MVVFPEITELFSRATEEARLRISREIAVFELGKEPSPEGRLFLERDDPAQRWERGLLRAIRKEMEGDFRSASLLWEELGEPFGSRARLLRILSAPPVEVMGNLLEGEPPPTPHLLWIASARSLLEGWDRSLLQGLLSLFPLYPPPLLAPPSLWLLPPFLNPPFSPTALSTLLPPLRHAFPKNLFLLEIEIALLSALGEKQSLLSLLTPLDPSHLPPSLSTRNFHLLLDLLLYELSDESSALSIAKRLLPSLPTDPAILRRSLRLAMREEDPAFLRDILRYLKEASPQTLEPWLGVLGYLLVTRHRDLATWEEISPRYHPCTFIALHLSGKKEEWLDRRIEGAKTNQDEPGELFAIKTRIRTLWGERSDRTQSWLILTKALEEHPDHPELLRLRFEISEATRRYQDLDETLARLIPLTTDPKLSLQYRFRRAELKEMIGGKDEEAIPLYEEILRDHPGFLPAFSALERIYRRMREFRKLAELLMEKVEILDEREERIHALEELYSIAGDLLHDPELALKALEQLIPLAPDRMEFIEEHIRITLALEPKPLRTLKLLKGLIYSGALPEGILKELVKLWAELTLAVHTRPEQIPERFRSLVPLPLQAEWALRLRGEELKRFLREHDPQAFEEETGVVPQGQAISDPWLRTLSQNPEHFFEVISRSMDLLAEDPIVSSLRGEAKEDPAGILSALPTTLTDPARGIELWKKLPPSLTASYTFWIEEGSWTLSSRREDLPFLTSHNLPPLTSALLSLKAGAPSSLEKTLSELPPSVQQAFTFTLPPLYLREGMGEKACELALTSTPDPAQALATLAVYGKTMLELKRFSELAQVIEKAMEGVTDPSLGRTLKLLSLQVRYDAGDRIGVKEELLRVPPLLIEDPEGAKGWIAWIETAYPPRERGEILLAFGKESFLHPFRTDLLRRSAESFLEGGDPRGAITAFQFYLQIQPDAWEVRERLRDLLEKEGSPELPAILLEGLDHPAPQEVRRSWYLKLSRLLSGTGKDLEVLERAIAEDSEWVELYRLLIERSPEETARERIAVLWEKRITLTEDPLEKAQGYLFLGKTALSRGEEEKARKLLMESVRANPLNGEVYPILRDLCERTQKQSELISLLEEVIPRIPRKEGNLLGELYRITAGIQVQEGKANSALETLKQALILDPQNPELLEALLELAVKLKLPSTETLPWARSLVRQGFYPIALRELLNRAVDQRRYDYAFLLASLLRQGGELSGMGENIYRQGLKPLGPPSSPFSLEEWQRWISEITEIPLAHLKVYYLVGEAIQNAQASYVEARPQEERLRPGGEILKRWQEWCTWRGVETREWYRAPSLTFPETRLTSRKAIFFPPWENQEILFAGGISALELDLLAYPVIRDLSGEEREGYSKALMELKEGKGLFSGRTRSPLAKRIEENLPRRSRKELEELLEGISEPLPFDPSIYLKIGIAVMAIFAPDPGECLVALVGKENLAGGSSRHPLARFLYPVLTREKLAEVRAKLGIQK